MGKSLKLAEQENIIAMEYFEKKDYENAYKHWKVAYDNGSVEAIYHLGNMYYYGEGVEENHELGNTYFLECANTEDYENEYVLQAMFNIGNAYYHGDCVEQSFEIAFDWYKKAAEQGHLICMLNVGVAYFSGNQGLPRDFEQAAIYLYNAAKRGNDVAQHLLGILYLAGRGVEQDVEEAKYWLEEAAKQGNQDAIMALKNMPVTEEDSEDDYSTTSEEVKERRLLFKEVKTIDDPMEMKDTICINMHNLSEYNNRESYDEQLDNYNYDDMELEEIEEHALWGSKVALYLAGKAYRYGLGTKKDNEKGFIYLSKSAVYDYPDALCEVGFCYIDGAGTSKDLTRGMACIARAAEFNSRDALIFMIKYYNEADQKEKNIPLYHKLADIHNHRDACVNLGDIYYRSKLVEKDCMKAKYYYEKAIELGNRTDACTVLGSMYMFGEFGEEDHKMAYKYYKMAADDGDIVGKYYVGCMHFRGLGVEKDLKLAKEYLELCAEKGIEQAKNVLEILNKEEEEYSITEESYMFEPEGEPYNFPKDNQEDAMLSDLYDQKQPSELIELARKGDVVAQFRFGCLLDNNNYVKAAIYWMRVAAENGYMRAYNGIGYMYLHGRGVEQSNEKSLENYLKSAEGGCSVAQRNMGIGYEYGDSGLEIDLEKAIYWYEKAMDNGDLLSVRKLGRLYARNEHLDGDGSKAIEYYNKAIELGDAVSIFWLGELYEEGVRVKQDLEKAIKLYEEAGEKGVSQAYYKLGLLYKNYKSKLTNYLNKAYDNFMKAKEAGCEEENLDSLIEETLKEKCPHCDRFGYIKEKKGLFGRKRVCEKCNKTIVD